MNPLLAKILSAALDAVDPVRLVKENLRLSGSRLSLGAKKINLNDFGPIHVIACGKAAPGMYEGLRQVLAGRISGGASSLMIHPAPGIGLRDKTCVNRWLLKSGASILRSTVSGNTFRL